MSVFFSPFLGKFPRVVLTEDEVNRFKSEGSSLKDVVLRHASEVMEQWGHGIVHVQDQNQFTFYVIFA